VARPHRLIRQPVVWPAGQRCPTIALVNEGSHPQSTDVVKRFLLGRALATSQAEHQLLPKLLALPVFSSDALSSVAYATEEMMLVLAAAGSGALSAKLPLALAIALLLAIVVTSYRQTVKAYPQGGGSYIVARENLGTIPGLVAAAAILSDYVLTVAVSVTAGTIAVTSAAPTFAEHKVVIAMVFILLITIANLRGLKESGKIFALPTYGFIGMIAVMLVFGALRCVVGCPVADTSNLPLEPIGALTVFLVLRAFASGATALTGVEAIADGVQAFRPPKARNASQTLAIMGVVGASMFLGITLLAQALHVRVDANIAVSRSVLAQIGETVFGRTWAFFALQAFTAGILILAANTSFQDFPRLSSILARDRFMPAQFRNRGDRLVFSNGVVVLAVLAGLLVYVFHGELTRLIQLYVVGVFTAFTLSQWGMVRRWKSSREEGWQRRALINGVGAVTTGLVLVVVILAKFTHGAWIVILAVPLIVAFFLAVHRHYERTAALLRHRDTARTGSAFGESRFVILVREFDAATEDAIAHLLAVRAHDVTPLYIGPEAGFEEARERWTWAAPRFGELLQLRGAQGHVAGALQAYLRELQLRDDAFVTVVLPEVVDSGLWWQLVRQRKALWLKASLLFRSNVALMDVPLVREGQRKIQGFGRRPVGKLSHAVLIPVSAVHEATARAVAYAKSLRPSEVEAVFFATDPDEVEGLIFEWWDKGMDVPLAIVDSPFRDIGPPLLAEIRRRTRRGDTTVTIVLPEFVVNRWWEHALHNQTGFYIKRLLLLEPNVVVANIPVHLGT
jgi:amino acid transporter